MNAPIQVERYSPERAVIWNEFVRASRNGTFLFDRNYMDYHATRFADWSLMIRCDGTLSAVLAANRVDDALVSHGGLTYGGLIVGPDMTTAKVIKIFAAVLKHLKDQDVAKLLYKTIPSIYHQMPSEEDRYALFLANARLYRRDVLSVVSSSNRLAYQERRKRGIRKAAKCGTSVGISTRWSDFWRVLEDRLDQKYGVQPVHTLAEIQSLAFNFPENIKLFATETAGRLSAGIVVFESRHVAHAQYIAATLEGRNTGALDLLCSHLLETYRQKPWFDFGISNEDNGRYLNSGLIDYKEGFGSRAVMHDFYLVEATKENIANCRVASS